VEKRIDDEQSDRHSGEIPTRLMHNKQQGIG
jgi:hypothetical protein